MGIVDIRPNFYYRSEESPTNQFCCIPLYFTNLRIDIFTEAILLLTYDFEILAEAQVLVYY